MIILFKQVPRSLLRKLIFQSVKQDYRIPSLINIEDLALLMQKKLAELYSSTLNTQKWGHKCVMSN